MKRQAEIGEEQSALTHEDISGMDVEVLKLSFLHPRCSFDDLVHRGSEVSLPKLLRTQEPRVSGTYSRNSTMLVDTDFISASFVFT